MPDETAIGKFPHLLEAHQLGEQLFARIQKHLITQGLQVSRETTVDTTIIAAPSSTKNRTKAKVRAKVEHVFLVIKQIFGWSNVHYRGLMKNTHWLFISSSLTNLCVAHRHLLTTT